jgi:hypothetical protein
MVESSGNVGGPGARSISSHPSLSSDSQTQRVLLIDTNGAVDDTGTIFMSYLLARKCVDCH